MFGQPLTNSDNRGRRPGETPLGDFACSPVWPAMANAEANGETENARNVGQLGTCGNGYAVNKLRGKRCKDKNWLPK